MLGRFGSGLVLLKPAPAGTGVIAGGPVRAVIQAVGIPNVLTKSIGSHNPHNVVKATIDALEQLRDKSAVAEMRGLAVGEAVDEGENCMAEGKIKIKLVRSPICTPREAQGHRASPRACRRSTRWSSGRTRPAFAAW